MGTVESLESGGPSDSRGYILGALTTQANMALVPKALSQVGPQMYHILIQDTRFLLLFSDL